MKLRFVNKYQDGGEYTPTNTSGLNYNISRRLPANTFEYLNDGTGASVVMSALFRYLFNDNNYVEKQVSSAKDALEFEGSEEWKKKILSIVDKTGMSEEKARIYFREHQLGTIGVEDIKDIYLGAPLHSNTVSISKYRPKFGDSGETYYASSILKDPTILDKYIMPAYYNLKNKNVSGKLGAGELLSIGKSGVNGVTTMPILGHATIGYGLDPNNGPYVSYYDKWDVDLTGDSNTEDWVSKILKANPVHLYDRIYLNDYYGINPRFDSDEYFGDYLPEITVTNK